MIRIYHAPNLPHVAVVQDEITAEVVVNALRRHRNGKGSTPKAYAMRDDRKRYTFEAQGKETWR